MVNKTDAKIQVVEYTKDKTPEAYSKGMRFASRCRPLGLTAYGSTLEEANNHLFDMFQCYVRLHQRAQGYGN